MRIFGVIVLAGLLLFSVSYYFKKPQPEITLVQTRFEQLPGWNQDQHAQALDAFQKSCTEIQKRNPQKIFSSLAPSITNKTWQSICAIALNTPATEAKNFFEKWFSPFQVKNNYKSEGLFTGYYLPLLTVSLKKTKHYNVPIYGLPNDLVKINLADFDVGLKRKTLVAKLQDKKLLPYPARIDIERGAIANNAKVLAWSNNPVDVFVAQIQGSAVAMLPTGEKFLLSYAGTNGRAYTAIGKALVASNAIPKDKVSLQSIKSWLAANPNKTAEILQQNASYVFFSKQKLSDPIGSQRVPLTPQRSLAVDTAFIPLGVPIWLSTQTPLQANYHRLLIAQDTGGAIKGVIRGDIYWGSGDQAELEAGQMQQSGKIWLLLPRSNA